MIRLKEGQDYSKLSVEKIIRSMAPAYQGNLEKFEVSLKKARLDEKQLQCLRDKIPYADARINQKLGCP